MIGAVLTSSIRLIPLLLALKNCLEQSTEQNDRVLLDHKRSRWPSVSEVHTVMLQM